MFNRRQFLTRAVRGSSLLALGSAVPQFVAQTARAAAPGKDTILVVVEMTGGNDGLNTVIPYADDLYHKARPTLRQTKQQVVVLDDHVGLHSGMQALRPLWEAGNLAVVQGVGYPNPDRSHFEAMDIWHTADPKRAATTGWLGRASGEMENRSGGVPILHVGTGKAPLAATGAQGRGAVSVGDQNSFRLELGNGDRKDSRRKLLDAVTTPATSTDDDDPLAFVQRRQVQTLTAVENLRELLEGPRAIRGFGGGLQQKFQLIAGLIARGFGTRIFYVSLDGFDTHADQAPAHQQLLTQLATGIGEFFRELKDTGNDSRVRVLTFSEFGRRVNENGSRGTDHGAASCVLLAGGGVKGGVVGKHPSLSDLDSDDLKYHTDFRSLYATLLDDWLNCDSKSVLGAKWDHIKALAAR
ncbi:Uncharacterized protein OS=Singulisphaera acidiphila (strain ATCC BAA-1392 / DSM 18658 / VKM B-2454 / MOB10) GN=Sinac_7508 PE=4 SV=1: DUF1501 [Gemmata massiliana]|uniref:DUF1501 domain-containing protein n=1 Tax=Gemmata massiliana TaxID=1210884 RepID=A0A6P2D367_9BACT|nr:DUF1501 domain-containing protein [Gemmata massiliana]VTR95741.1 Uncharacterized protein OS=Singulisphaera acidiphila (strain ATCC BAA-1392 / DSM 18658 / VKM B-2454 / MOB10) GN=Sinac_7508 PE=4 SV=1: DUF1501 [Gemmata massiliana]